jgi:hypothetical protein
MGRLWLKDGSEKRHGAEKLAGGDWRSAGWPAAGAALRHLQHLRALLAVGYRHACLRLPKLCFASRAVMPNQRMLLAHYPRTTG